MGGLNPIGDSCWTASHPGANADTNGNREPGQRRRPGQSWDHPHRSWHLITVAPTNPEDQKVSPVTPGLHQREKWGKSDLAVKLHMGHADTPQSRRNAPRGAPCAVSRPAVTSPNSPCRKRRREDSFGPSRHSDSNLPQDVPRGVAATARGGSKGDEPLHSEAAPTKFDLIRTEWTHRPFEPGGHGHVECVRLPIPNAPGGIEPPTSRAIEPVHLKPI